MSSTLRSQPASAEELLCLHDRLLAGSVTAGAELCNLLLEELITVLRFRHPHVEEPLCWDAAGDALMTLILRPASFTPEGDGSRLWAQLYWAARCDLLNRLKKERRQQGPCVPWSLVEDSPDAGKYLGREDPASSLGQFEQESWLESPAARAVIARFTDVERLVLDLMRAGENRTAAIANAIGLSDKPRAEQQKQVKRIRDRILQRLKRAGGNCERSA